MANKPYSIDIITDTAQAVKGTDNLADAIEDLADSLDNVADDSDQLARETGKSFDDMARDAKDAGRKIENELSEATTDAGRDAEKMETSFTEAFKKVRSESEKTQSDIADHSKRMGDVQEEVTSEMAQNFGSTMASFDGSAQSMVQIIADSFGGLAGSMAVGGPIGSLFLGAAAGLTALWAQDWFDKSDKVEERTSAMYTAMLDSANAYFTQATIVDRFHSQISGNKDEDPSLLSGDDFDKVVEASGLSKQDVALAIADPRSDAAAQLQAAMQSREDAQVAAKPETKPSQGQSSYGLGTAKTNEWATELGEIREARDILDQYNGTVESTSASVLDNTEYLRANGIVLENAGQTAREYERAQVAAKTALDDAKAAISTNNDALGGAAAATDENEAALSDMVDQLLSVQTAMADTGAKTDEITQLQKDQAEAFIQAGEAAGYNRDEAIDLAEHLGLIPHEVATQLKQTGADQVQSDAQLTMTTLDKIPSTKEIQTVLVPPMQQAVNDVLSVMRTMLGTMKIPVEPVTSRSAYPNG